MRTRFTRYFVWLSAVALLITGLAVVGCGGDATTTTAAPTDTTAGATDTTAAPTDTTAAPAMDLKFAASNQHQMAFSYGKSEMAKLVGAEFITADANLTPAKQVTDIDTFISQKVNGITSWTLDQGAATAVYQRAQDAGIPVVTENSPGEFVTTVFAQEQNMTRKAQIDAAEWFAEVYPGAKMFVIGGPPVPYILYVTKNMEEEGAAAGLTVLSRQDNMTDQANGAQVIVQDLLTKYPDVQIVWCFNDRSALGASAALRAAGKKIYNAANPEPGAVMVTGMNGTQEALEAVKAGIITATYAGQSEKVGAAEIELLARIATGEMAASDVPSVVVCPYKRWDGTNVDDTAFPMDMIIELGVLDEFLNYSTDPSTIDDFMEFVGTL
ncbi:MAG: sugar ABC transporter substrate-binding protein [Thermoleophilia bacterium]